MLGNSAEPWALRTRFPDRQKTSVETTAAAVTFQWCVQGKEENGRQFPQPFWKTPFNPLKHEVAGPTTSLLPRWGCSSFYQHRSIPRFTQASVRCQVGQKPSQFCSAWWEADSTHPMWIIPALKHLTASPHMQNMSGEENDSEDLFAIKHLGLKDN